MSSSASTLSDTESGAALRGVLSRVGLPEILQTVARRDGTARIDVRRDGWSGSFWLLGQSVVHATIEGGAAGWPAVHEMLSWTEGRFEASYDVELPRERTVDEIVAGVLLEAARVEDEARRRGEPLHAAIPHDPPQPPAEVRAAHCALMVMNVASSALRGSFRDRVLSRLLEESRLDAAAGHDLLVRFAVVDGAVSWRGGAVDVPAPPFAAATARWLDRLERRAAEALPGAFAVGALEPATRSLQDDLAELGFLDALGWTTETR